MQTSWGPLRSLLALSPLLLVAWVTLRIQYALPTPLTEPVSAEGKHQLSEARVLAHARYLSEDIGYRVVGTAEHARADVWMLERANELKRECERIAEAEGRRLQCEVWHQKGNGKHRFDMMGRRLYKTYVGLTNIVLRISNGTPEGKRHAVLANSHVDSTIPSPGAADDALAVGVLLECARVLVNTPGWEPAHAIVLLFNNAEESLQDGSHLFSTQHPIAHTVQSVINLEAAGTTGRDLLFQATSEHMIEAYSHVPRPFGTIFANDIFSSGVLLSDTDFRQFAQYLGVPGLDMAVVGNSYLYHMRKDLVENIEPGVAQNMGENALSLLFYLSSAQSPLPNIAKERQELVNGTATSVPLSRKSSTVYFSYLSRFFMYTFETARWLYAGLLIVSVIFAGTTFVQPAPALKHGVGVCAAHTRSAGAIMLGLLGSVAGANFAAFIMSSILGRRMSWFQYEYSCVMLYGPAALFGALVSQLFVGIQREHTLLTSTLVLQSFSALVIQLLGVGSAVAFALTAIPLQVALLLGIILQPPSQRGDHRTPVSLWVYVLGSLSPVMTGVQIMFSTIDVFVPLTGRIGHDVPADHVIATLVTVLGAYCLPLTLPFAHRFGPRALRKGAGVIFCVMVLMMAIFMRRSPFDSMHQRRLFVLHMHNTTTGAEHLHLAVADAAPGVGQLMNGIASDFGSPEKEAYASIMNDWNPDWDIIYPFSAFVAPYKIPLATPSDLARSAVPTIGISVENEVIDHVAGTRSVRLVIRHTGIIWTAIAFDAHVLEWNLDDNPPNEYARHHIKEASFHGVDTWSLDLVLRQPSSSGEPPLLRVDHVGIRENVMWPGKKGLDSNSDGVMTMFASLDAWLEEKADGAIDSMLVGCVGGVSHV